MGGGREGAEFSSAGCSVSAHGPPPSWAEVECAACPAEVLGADVSRYELGSEVPGARPLHTVPYEQVKLD